MVQFKVISSSSFTWEMAEEATPYLATLSFQEQ